MRKTLSVLFQAALLALFVMAMKTGSLPAQSEHAIEKARELAKTHPEYEKDILLSKPDFIVFAPKQDFRKVGDTYNDHFQVFDKPDGTLFAVWTQATREGNVDHHIAFSKSTDKGLTWSEPEILAGSANAIHPQLRASWQQPMVSKSGRIYVLWVQQISNTLNQHCGAMFGIFSDNDGDSWSAPRQVTFGRQTEGDTGTDDPTPMWCNWQRPLRLGEGGRYLAASSHHQKLKNGEYVISTEYLQYDNIDDDPPVENIRLKWFCVGDKGLFWQGFSNTCEESSLVKLPDGRLFTIMRTSAGYPVWSVSGDNGQTWAEPKPLRDRDGGEVLKHPRSPCPIYDRYGCEAGSGYYFAFIHNTFDENAKTEWQNRGPLYLIAGKYQPDAEQPVWFAPAQLFSERESNNSFYTSSTVIDGKTVLWYNDKKFYLLGRYIGDEWFRFWDEQQNK